MSNTVDMRDTRKRSDVENTREPTKYIRKQTKGECLIRLWWTSDVFSKLFWKTILENRKPENPLLYIATGKAIKHEYNQV